MVNLESNLYISVFIPHVEEDLGLLLKLEDEIAQERSLWLNSGAAKELAVMRLEALGYEPVKIREDILNQQAETEQNLMFGRVDLSPNFVHHSSRVFGQLSLRQRKMLDDIAGIINEHRRNYLEAIKPLDEQRRGVEGEVYNKWLDYMNGLGPVQDFSRFLSDDEFLLDREQQKPFLQLLYRRLQSGGRNISGNLYNLFGSKIVENAVVNPEQNTFADFLETLSTQKQTKALEVIQQWLRLVSFSLDGIDHVRVFERIAGSGIFPADLRGHFATYIQGRLAPCFATIAQCLEVYKPTDMLRPTLSLDMRRNQRTKQNQILKNGNAPGITDQSVESNKDNVPEKPTYKLVIGGSTNVSQEALDSYVGKIADGLAPHDGRMKNDVRGILEAVSRDPFGIGFCNLTDQVTPSLDGNKKLPLRRFRPDKRPLLTLEHPDSRTIRVVFHTEKKDGVNCVVIHHVLRHPDFDRLYTS